MRRQDRALTDRAAIEALIQRCQVCRLGLVDEAGQPYVVPLFFGYDGERLYLHSAREGRKLDLLRRHPRVCVEFDELLELVPASSPCAFSARYQSVIAFGTARLVEDVSEKQRALALLMAHYGHTASFTPEETATVAVICVELETITAKQHL